MSYAPGRPLPVRSRRGDVLLVFGAVLGVWSASMVALHKPSSLQVTSGRALDGDTFVSAGIHYRLSGIDAPELPGHCAGWRLRHASCAPGDPFAAKAALQSLLDTGLICQPAGPDYYGRTLVTCHTADTSEDVGDLLVSSGYAVPYSYQGPRS